MEKWVQTFRSCKDYMDKDWKAIYRYSVGVSPFPLQQYGVVLLVNGQLSLRR
ncbi:hypothetical protein M408DRAFT_162603 [Serendipita vermifera MAFF 305830]|uniref:Uncharacterized protein n=1 Tax=Serendipita vermifera MAFF 305830 TaxID=933852 RepID=A0A0C2WN29_SERVB|nr:hypothetical protein M408DRAFT_162603 [Serendipita vermifera MAFF 305830]